MPNHASLEEILAVLSSKARPEQLAGLARFGLQPENRLGVSIPELRRLAKTIGHSHSLALDLWRTQIPDAQMLASMVADPEALTNREMTQWAADFRSWDVCDQTCLNLFVHSPLAWPTVAKWAGRREEFVKRAAFALIACLAVHDKGASDAKFTGTFPMIRRAAEDERNYVRKAVSWALRGMGKRNSNLHLAALDLAKELSQSANRTARWIAADTKADLRKKWGPPLDA